MLPLLQVKNLSVEIRTRTGTVKAVRSTTFSVADKAAVMYAGTVVEIAPVRRLFRGARHPYTRGLLTALPRLNGDPEQLQEIPGDPPDMMHPPPGCPFRPRCPNALSRCELIEPPSVELSEGHIVKCWLVHPKADETR